MALVPEGTNGKAAAGAIPDTGNSDYQTAKVEMSTLGVGESDVKLVMDNALVLINPNPKPSRERVLFRQPTGPNPLYHRDD